MRLEMVPRAGVEPAHPKIQDFESSASANSAIWAYPRFGKKASCPLNARIRFRLLSELISCLSGRVSLI